MHVAESGDVWRCRITIAQEEATAAKPITEEELLRLFSILSHDLKSPIFAIDGFSELLLADYLANLDEEGQDFLRRIRSSAQHMKKVLDQMSQMIKLLARPNMTRATPLREIVEEVILKHNYAIEEGGVSVAMPNEMPVVNLDPEKMREAIGAIIANALFFTERPKGERQITIEGSSQPGTYRLCIRDNGIGIDPRYANQVFDVGGASRLDKTRGGGPGYGLYMAKRVIESHGGSVSVDSVPGEGSNFCLTLPVETE